MTSLFGYLFTLVCISSFFFFFLPSSFCFLYLSKSKVGDCCGGRPEGSVFNSYFTEMLWGGATPFPCSTLPFISTLYCWVLSKEISSTIFKVFGMTRPGIEPRSPRPLANTLPTKPMSRSISKVDILSCFQSIFTFCQMRVHEETLDCSSKFLKLM